MKTDNRKYLIVAAILVFVAWRAGLLGDVVPGGSAPFATDKLSVLIVEETSDRDDLPSAQVSAIESTVWREYVAGKGGEVRVLEPEAKLSNEEDWVSAALAVKRDSIPWLVVSNGKRGSSGPLPENLDGLLAKIKETGE